MYWVTSTLMEAPPRKPTRFSLFQRFFVTPKTKLQEEPSSEAVYAHTARHVNCLSPYFAMVSETLSIYAELLPSIRQVSVAASLPVEPAAATRAQVFADGSRIGIRYGRSAKDLLLPGVVTAPPLLPIPKGPSRSLSWRLPLAASQPSPASLAHDHYPTPPWSSADLQPGSPVTCRRCDNAVLPPDAISLWKDLPSENWAEMMEFWHCHKPEPHNHQNHEHLADRGYGANAGISAQDSVGFIDIMSFLFTEHDTTGLKVSCSHCYVVHVSSMVFFPTDQEVMFRWSGVPRRWPSRHRSLPMSWSPIQHPNNNLQRATISAHHCLFPFTRAFSRC